MTIEPNKQFYSASQWPAAHSKVGLMDPDLETVETTASVRGFTSRQRDTALVVLDGEPDIQRRVSTDKLWRLTH